MTKHNIWRITLDTNPEDCNLQCIMCEEHSPFSNFRQTLFKRKGVKKRLMPKEWLEPIFQQAKEMGINEIIPSTMGEPLIYKHFNHFIELCCKYDIKMNLTTNGTFPGINGKTASEWATVIIPITTDVKISWNGATAETSEKIMRGIDFEQAVRNVREFINIRNQHFLETNHYCRITFQLTFMRNNMNELTDIIKLAAELGIDRVKGHQLWTHFDEIRDLSFRQHSESIEKWNNYVAQARNAIEKCRKSDGSKVELENIVPLKEQEVSEVPINYVCPFLNRELWISATGKISPCCAPDILRNELGSFGNIQNMTLLQSVEGEEYQNLQRSYKQIPLCKTCNMRRKEQ